MAKDDYAGEVIPINNFRRALDMLTGSAGEEGLLDAGTSSIGIHNQPGVFAILSSLPAVMLRHARPG